MNQCSNGHEESCSEASHWATACPICELLGAEDDEIAELAKELVETNQEIDRLSEQLAGTTR